MDLAPDELEARPLSLAELCRAAGVPVSRGTKTLRMRGILPDMILRSGNSVRLYAPSRTAELIAMLRASSSRQ